MNWWQNIVAGLFAAVLPVIAVWIKGRVISGEIANAAHAANLASVEAAKGRAAANEVGKQLEVVVREVNSKMDVALKTAADEGYARGVLAGVEQERVANRERRAAEAASQTTAGPNTPAP